MSFDVGEVTESLENEQSGKALGCGLDGPGLIPGGGGVEIFFTTLCPDWSWGPLIFL